MSGPAEDRVECRGRVQNGFSTIACNRTPRTPEQIEAGLCGLHLAGRRRTEKARAETIRRLDEGENRKKAAEAACSRLESLGIHAFPDYDALWPWVGSGWTGKVVVDGDVVADVIETAKAIAREAVADEEGR